MPDSDEIALVRDALEVEARKWDEMTATMGAAGRKAHGLTLEPSSFWASPVPGVSGQLSSVYQDVHKLIINLMSDAAIEFSEIAGALRTAAYRYDGTDQNQARDLVEIYGRYNTHP
ncbi:hypothetical protein [Melissospora conviva]|uniref:hypothetical protein n=1 Tax=Melissospora conviva TaxID=3388432 RepID=UPI003C13E7BB